MAKVGSSSSSGGAARPGPNERYITYTQMLTIPTIATAMSARTARDLPLRRGDPGVGVGDEGAGAVPITASASPLPPAVATQAPTPSMTTVEPRGALWPGRGDCATPVSSRGPSAAGPPRPAHPAGHAGAA